MSFVLECNLNNESDCGHGAHEERKLFLICFASVHDVPIFLLPSGKLDPTEISPLMTTSPGPVIFFMPLLLRSLRTSLSTFLLIYRQCMASTTFAKT